MDERRNLCAMIPMELHTKVREEQESLGQTLSQYVEQILKEHFEGKDKCNINDNTKTLALQISEELFGRIQDYLTAERQRTGQKLTQKAFIIGLIEQALDEWEHSQTEPEN